MFLVEHYGFTRVGSVLTLKVLLNLVTKFWKRKLLKVTPQSIFNKKQMKVTAKHVDFWLNIFEALSLMKCHKDYGSDIRIQIMSENNYDIQRCRSDETLGLGKLNRASTMGPSYLGKCKKLNQHLNETAIKYARREPVAGNDIELLIQEQKMLLSKFKNYADTN